MCNNILYECRLAEMRKQKLMVCMVCKKFDDIKNRFQECQNAKWIKDMQRQYYILVLVLTRQEKNPEKYMFT